MVHGYLTPDEESRAAVAYWWRTTPDALDRISRRRYRMMAEFMARVEKARKDAAEAAKMGLPTPGRSPKPKPQPGDKVLSGAKGDDGW